VSTPPLTERFWAKVNKTEDGCWMWTGAANQFGYGICTIARRQYVVHRIAYATLVEPLRDGGYIDHMCHNRRCVNPAHLQQVTNQQNVENRAGANANSTSGVRGVSWDKARQSWSVNVKTRYVKRFGGRFHTLAEAEAAAIALRNQLMTNNRSDWAL